MTNESFFREEAKDKQEGGNHYKIKIQPYDFIMSNDLNFFQGNVIKYAVRYLKKNKIEDLNKIIHYCELEIDRLRKEWDK